MRQLQFFTTAELAKMRDRTKSRSYSPAGDEFRRIHERHRAWGLKRRHAERLRQIQAARASAALTAASTSTKHDRAAQPASAPAAPVPAAGPPPRVEPAMPPPAPAASTRAERGHDRAAPRVSAPAASVQAADPLPRTAQARNHATANAVKRGRDRAAKPVSAPAESPAADPHPEPHRHPGPAAKGLGPCRSSGKQKPNRARPRRTASPGGRNPWSRQQILTGTAPELDRPQARATAPATEHESGIRAGPGRTPGTGAAARPGSKSHPGTAPPRTSRPCRARATATATRARPFDSWVGRPGAAAAPGEGRKRDANHSHRPAPATAAHEPRPVSNVIPRGAQRTSEKHSPAPPATAVQGRQLAAISGSDKPFPCAWRNHQSVHLPDQRATEIGPRRKWRT